MTDFDPDWYRERYPDVALSGMSPTEHYQRVGRLMGRAGSALDESTVVRSASMQRTPVMPLTASALIGPEVRRAIYESGLFDEAWYRASQSGGLAADADALDDYLHRSHADPTVGPMPFFSNAHYRVLHPDTHEMPPLVHSVMYGLKEGRALFEPGTINLFLEQSITAKRSPLGDLIPVGKPVKVLFWGLGNFFFSEIAAYVSAYLQELGYQSSLGEGASKRELATHTLVVVAPHEFCIYGEGKDWPDTALNTAVYLNTEQWHTSWFALAYRFILRSRRALDMNPASASGLSALGIGTAFVPLLPLNGSPFAVEDGPISDDFARDRDLLPLTYPADILDRPYDIFFVGALNERRGMVLSHLGETLAERDALIHCPRHKGPVRTDDPDAMQTKDVVRIARNSKILLNVHQGESRYFEWHRLFLFGIMEGAVVVTEPSLPNSFVTAGTHYIECEAADMPAVIERLLDTPSGRDELTRIHANCRALRAGAQRAQDFGQ